MTQPDEPTPRAPVPVGQRAVNAATSGITAMLVMEGCKAYMLVFHPDYAGKAPQLAFAIGAAAAALMGTLGSVARKQIAESPPTSFMGKLVLGILSNAG